MSSHRATPLDSTVVTPLDSTLALAVEGYAWLPNRMRRAGGDVLSTRLAGRRTVALRGPAAARFFYDERNVRRHGALPEPVRSTLFGHGAVHTLDGAAHRARKAMFLALLTDAGGVDGLVARAGTAWDEAVAGWATRSPVVLFDEAAQVLTRAVCDWAGVPVTPAQTPGLAADLVTLVDGFGTAGPRHWRARWARRRREAWLADLIDRVRRGEAAAPPGSAVDVVARHRDADGAGLDGRTAAVELLNVLRPTVAVSWFLAFAAHAVHQWPWQREQLREGAPGYPGTFVHEVRRFYPFAPFVGGRAVRDLEWAGEPIPAGATVLLDIYGQHHDDRFWRDPYRFDPDRFLDREVDPYELLPQGGGDPAAGHRCPGEAITEALLGALAVRLAHLDYTLPEQDLTIALRRVPTRPRSGVLIAVRPPR
ncbi:cytochrome P450 [Micromonospora sp. WMMD882]|uniref:cytochrome P450 n=1 Tax=Micromonospora sp. WMMD882 TaxID=3015151 RepID=UPI00248D2BC6|nr:cytochrome P450 [Micromonospora sp. WMMD882]WBB81647.1 cytochrome P450 [Micromonospora sp. WMMD882]